MSKKSAFTLRSGNTTPFKEMGSSPVKSWADYLQTGLSVAGMVPIIGNLADAANVGVSGARAGYAKFQGREDDAKKHSINMAINAAAAIPGAGQAVTATKLAAQGGKALAKEMVKGGTKQLAKNVVKKGAKKTVVKGSQKLASDKVDSDALEKKNQSTVAIKGKGFETTANKA